MKERFDARQLLAIVALGASVAVFSAGEISPAIGKAPGGGGSSSSSSSSSGGSGGPAVRYKETPGQRAMKRRQAKRTVKQPGPFTKAPGRQAPVPFGQQPIHGNPSAPVPFGSHMNGQ